LGGGPPPPPPPPGRQVDVTSRTEGKATMENVPTLVKYDARLRENVAKTIVEDVTTAGEQVSVVTGLPGGSRRLRAGGRVV